MSNYHCSKCFGWKDKTPKCNELNSCNTKQVASANMSKLILSSGKGFINKYARGHIFVFIKFSAGSKDTHLVSNETFFKYTTKYRALYRKQLQPRFNISSKSIFVETHYYDQVWAIALAINNSLPELNNRNLSIDNYTIGQPLVTAVIEEQMKNLRFQGASIVVYLLQ